MQNTIINNNFDSKTKYQKYSHYLLPIAIEPLKYGKLIEQIGNKYIIQLNTSNVLVINVIDNNNFIRFFRKGNLMIEFIDSKVSENIFTRTITDQKFTFEKNKLITTEILSGVDSITIFSTYEDTNSIALTPFAIKNSIFLKSYRAELVLIFLVFIIFFVIFPEENISLAAFSSSNIIKLRRSSKRNAWDEYRISLNNKIFSKNLFEKLIKKFWNKIGDKFRHDNHLYLLLKVQYTDGNFVTIGSLQRLNKEDLNWYIDLLLSSLQFKSEYYKETQINEIIITYGFKNEIIPKKTIIASTTNTTELNKINIINSMIPSDFGTIIETIKKEKSIIFIIQNKLGQTITLEQFQNYNLVKIAFKGQILVEFRDDFVNNNEFIRIINDKKYYFKDNLQVLFTKDFKTKFISKIKKSEELTNKFLTLDIETFIQNGVLIPFLICVFDGENKLIFGLWDYNSIEEMILDALNSILIRKYNGYKVYIHNMAKFDIIFILKYLLKVADCEPIIHNDKMLSLKAKFGEKTKYQIEFKDSYLILLSSLDKLSKFFKIDNPKTIFPFLFVNINNLDFEGKVPNIEMFGEKISLTEFTKYKNSFKNKWNLKNEAIKYCINDCVALHQIIIKFNSMIFSLFSINIHHYFDGSISELSSFIKSIGDDKIYLLIPLFFYYFIKNIIIYIILYEYVR